MKRICFIILAIMCIVNVRVVAQHHIYQDLVDPTIGSGNSRWFFFNSASRPFGMVNLSPDTDNLGSWKSGYLYHSKYIRFFSHIHAWQLSGIAVMPTVGTFKGHQGNEAYKSSFSHNDEVVKAGYQRIVLDDYKITAEITSTKRVGMHRYTFPKSDEAYILFDLGATLGHGPKSYSEAWVTDSCTISGYEIMDRTPRRPKNTAVYFYAKFDKKFDDYLTWRDGMICAEEVFPKEKYRVSGSGEGVGIAVKYKTSDAEKIQLKVGISYVNIEQAKKNMETEIDHWNFDSVKQDSYKEWDDMLGRIAVEGGNNTQRVKFYTDLWHSLLGRRTISDVDGKYTDMTGNAPTTRTMPKNKCGEYIPHYNFDAMWGAQWSINTLWGMAYPEIYDGFCHTMVEMYKNGGLIPRGPAGGNYTYVMIGDQASWFIASAYHKGATTVDMEKAYEGLRKNAFPGGIRDRAGYEHVTNPVSGGIKEYIEMGYVPYDMGRTIGYHHKATSAMTLEYAYTDWCLSQIAKSMGKKEDYIYFMNRSRNYKNCWNPKSGFMQGRMKNGCFEENFDPANLGAFCESNAYVGTYWVPQDPCGLSHLLGGDTKAVKRLDGQLKKSQSSRLSLPYACYTNQPGTGMAHLFNHWKAPWLAQYWIRQVHKIFTEITPDGAYARDDEDQGLMGSLLALCAIGFFQETGGADCNPVYEITSPIFDKITIHLNRDYYKGDHFEIITHNNSERNCYIQSAQINGIKLNDCWINHSDFIKGGKLELIMGNKPNKQWGIKGVPVGQ